MSICPDFEWIKALKNGFGPEGMPWKVMSQATGVHPNPRLYKYYWWVFWAGSPVDGKAFLDECHRLPWVASEKLMAELKAKNEPYILYNQQLPRRDPANPFDFNGEKWHHCEWALPYDKDPDLIATGAWEGHR